MTAPEIATALKQKFADAVQSHVSALGEETLTVKLSHVKSVLRYCRDEMAFDYLVDISSLDHLGTEPRFEMVYELYGYSHGSHLRIKAKVDEDQPAPTVTDLWATADWHEREVYDMMGITFDGHPDMRRILMWEGYPFFPLRKDFPLEGRPSDMPDVAFTGVAPLEGGPFVTCATDSGTVQREPRARSVD
jgi:NADH-quinone oxidoreductase subunit C